MRATPGAASDDPLPFTNFEAGSMRVTRASADASFAAAKRMHVDGEHLDRHGIELGLPRRHHAAAAGADGLDDVDLAAAIEPDAVGEVRRAHLLGAFGLGAVAGGALLAED